MNKLPIQFCQRAYVVNIARELAGKIIAIRFGSIDTSGRIVEADACIVLAERDSYSFDGKQTSRNGHMFGAASTAYVYIC